MYVSHYDNNKADWDVMYTSEAYIFYTRIDKHLNRSEKPAF